MRIANLCQLLSRRLAWNNGAGRCLFVLPLLVAALAVANVQPVRAEMAGHVGMDLNTNEVKLNDDNDFTQDTTITVNHATRKFNLSMFADTAELKSTDDKNTASIKPIGGGNRDLAAGQWGYRLAGQTKFSPVSADQAKPTILKQNADGPQQMDEKVTFAVNKSGVPQGTYQTKVTYTLTLAPSSWPFDSDTCRSGDQKSGCKVDIDPHMIPVKYTGSETKPEWQTVAKSEDATHQGDWYDYNQRRWANAITVKPEALAKYQGKSVKVDDADVLGYWVYVPRYSYKVRDYSDVDKDSHGVDNNFEIKFERANQPRRSSNPSDTVDHDTYEPDSASKSWGWATPRGFVFGDRDLNGIWLSKYQISFANNTAQSLPNQPMLRGGTKDTDLLVKSLTVLQSIGKPDPNHPNQSAGEVDLPPVKPNAHNLAELSSRMPRSSEYATAIYLAYSKYGIGLNREHKYTEGKNRGKVKWYDGIQGNNFDLFTRKDGERIYGSVTGCGPLADQSTAKYGKEGSAVRGGEAGTNAACGVDLKHGYYTKLGQLASTSGNQTGIYDMAGSNSWEVTASLTKNVNGDENSDNSDSGIEDEGKKLSFKEVLERQFESGKLPAPYYEYLMYNPSDDEQNEFNVNSGKDFGDDIDYDGAINDWINYVGMANDEFSWSGGDYLDGSTRLPGDSDSWKRFPLVSRGSSDGDDAENNGVSSGPLSMYISSIFKTDGSDTYRAVLTLPPIIPENDDSDD